MIRVDVSHNLMIPGRGFRPGFALNSGDGSGDHRQFMGFVRTNRLRPPERAVMAITTIFRAVISFSRKCSTF
jgi:hypothetical protein